ncbi:MAG: saccharopine dehydrogenase family protein [Planctomycetota bacterium]
MKVLVIGCGLQGFEIASDLFKDKHIKVGVCDISSERLRRIKNIGISSVHQMDINDKKHLTGLIKQYDLIVGAVPGKYGLGLVKTVIESGRDMVDISFMPEDAPKLDRLARQHNVKIVVDCGLAPGISNLLVGHAQSILKRIDEVHIAVGGLPQNPKPPLNYRTVFSLEDVMEEYTRKVRIIENGKFKIIEPMTGVEKIKFNGIGEFECFFTDGLRSLAQTVKGVKTMTEKTIRYPGHTAQIKTLIECGFLDTKPVEFRNNKVSPRDFTLKVLGDKLALGKDKDITLFRVVVKGEKTLKYELVDYYTNGVTSMARTTGYPCAIVARLMNLIDKVGVMPPEELGKNSLIFSQVIDGLKKRGIKIKETIC